MATNKPERVPPFTYRGWGCGFDPERPVTGRWQAIRHGVSICAGTREALERMIDFKVAEAQAGPPFRS
jgi:hypothetical protein